MTPEELQRLDDLAAIQTRIAELKVAEAELTAEIVAAYGVGVVKDALGCSVVEVQQPMKFSAAQAEKVLTVAPDLLRLVTTTKEVISADKAKEVLPPETYERCKVTNGKPKIKFINGEDEG